MEQLFFLFRQVATNENSEVKEELGEVLVGVVIDLFDYPEEEPTSALFESVEIGPDGSVYQHVSTWTTDERRVIINRNLRNIYQEMEEAS